MTLDELMAARQELERAKAKPALPDDSAARKALPLARGLLDYFPAACAAVSEVSRVGNDKHNPGEPMHHARGKSSDHADCIMRHLVDRGTTYTELVNGQPVPMRHSAALAWRAMALLQEELEAEGAPLARGAKLPAPAPAPAEQLALRHHPILQPEPGLYEVAPDGTVKFTPCAPLCSEPRIR